MNDNSTKPLKIFRHNALIDGVSIALFPGKYGPGITLNSSYKAADGTWKRSNSFFAKHLPSLITLLPEVLRFCNEMAEAKKSGVAGDQPVAEVTDEEMPY